MPGEDETWPSLRSGEGRQRCARFRPPDGELGGCVPQAQGRQLRRHGRGCPRAMRALPRDWSRAKGPARPSHLLTNHLLTSHLLKLRACDPAGPRPLSFGAGLSRGVPALAGFSAVVHRALRHQTELRHGSLRSGAARIRPFACSPGRCAGDPTMAVGRAIRPQRSSLQSRCIESSAPSYAPPRPIGRAPHADVMNVDQLGLEVPIR